MNSRHFYSFLFLLMATGFIWLASCDKNEEETPEPEPTINLALDSITTPKKHIVMFEEILVTAYARGENLQYLWETNHGSMLGKDSVTVRYWGCPSCIGLNTIQCTVSNEFGSISDTIMVRVDPWY